MFKVLTRASYNCYKSWDLFRTLLVVKYNNAMNIFTTDLSYVLMI